MARQSNCTYVWKLTQVLQVVCICTFIVVIDSNECKNNDKPCLFKCCGFNQILKKEKCLTEEKIKFKVPKKSINGTVELYDTDYFHLIDKKPMCTEKFELYYLLPTVHLDDSYAISENGALFNNNGYEISSPGQFCLEIFADKNFQILPIVCSRQKKKEDN